MFVVESVQIIINVFSVDGYRHIQNRIKNKHHKEDARRQTQKSSNFEANDRFCQCEQKEKSTESNKPKKIEQDSSLGFSLRIPDDKRDQKKD
ncbi:MAG: hypothetical protein Q8N59_01355 [bacterium]|nr:hypothetical protein [bacterium]